MENINLVEHPFVKNLVTKLRDVETNSADFRRYTNTITSYLVYSALSDVKLSEREVMTQTQGKYKGHEFSETIKFFGVLREGVAMMIPVMEELDEARFDLVGVKRDDTDPFEGKAKIYLDKFKDIEDDVDRVVIMDQMLATGGTILVLLESLIDDNRFTGKIDVISTIVAKVGADKINKRYPKVKITCAGFDTELNDGVNDVGYIYPGLGDASDRYFGISTDINNIG